MTPEQIIDGNKVCAEFLGYQYFPHPDEQDLPGWRKESKRKIIPKLMYSGDIGKCTYLCRVHKELRFDRDWQWLIPVVEKIETFEDDHHGKFAVFIYANVCSIEASNLGYAQHNRAYGWVYMSDPNAVFPTKIESTWYAVVEFIKWWNKNLKK